MTQCNATHRSSTGFRYSCAVAILLAVCIVSLAMNPWDSQAPFPDNGGTSGPYSEHVSREVESLERIVSNPAESLLSRHTAQYELGQLYFSLGNIDEAIHYWGPMEIEYSDLSHTVSPADPAYLVDDAVFMALVVRRMQGELEPVLNDLQAFMTEYPQSNRAADALYGIGEVFVELDKDYEAIAAFTQLIADYPESTLAPDAANHLGHTYERIGDIAAATEAYRSVRDDYPHSTAIRDSLFSLNGIIIDQTVGGCCSGNCCHNGGIGIGVGIAYSEVRDNLDMLLQGPADQHTMSGGIDAVRFIDFAHFCLRPSPIDPIGLGNLYGNVLGQMSSVNPSAPETIEVGLLYGKQLFHTSHSDGLTEIRKGIDMAEGAGHAELEFKGRHLLIRLLGADGDFQQVHHEIDAAIEAAPNSAAKGELYLERAFAQWQVGDLDGAAEILNEVANESDYSDEQRDSAKTYLIDVKRAMGIVGGRPFQQVETLGLGSASGQNVQQD